MKIWRTGADADRANAARADDGAAADGGDDDDGASAVGAAAGALPVPAAVAVEQRAVVLATETKPGVGLGLLTYLIAAPIIHSANDDGSRPTISLGLRIGVPVVLGGLGSMLPTCTGECDDGFVGRPRPLRSSAVRLTTSVDHGRTSFGLAGRF